jgi:hypothetical protein
METLTVKDFAAKVKSKKDLYEAVQRNGYHLPSIKSTLVTENYLINVMDGSYWCPKVEEIKLRQCPRPPEKRVLLKKFLDLMEGKATGISEKHSPNKEWLLIMIATLKPEDEIFRKDYLPPAKKKIIEEQKTIQIPKGFFDGLPDSKTKVKRRALKIMGQGMAQQKISYLKQLQKDISVAIIEQEVKSEKARSYLKETSTRKPEE